MFLLVFSLRCIHFTQSTITDTYNYEAHFIKDLDEKIDWTSCGYFVTIIGLKIVKSDRSKSFTYLITKESITKTEKGYTV